MSDDLNDTLAAGYLNDCLQQANLSIASAVQAKLLHYVQRMRQWNRVYNITGLSKIQHMITHHIMDSVSILPYLHGHSILDLGSGAGLPGIPLALCSPHRRFVLLDSNGKKTRFLVQMVYELGLHQVTVVQTRVETYAPAEPFDTIVSRGFSTLANIVSLVDRLCAQQGRLLLMKGSQPIAKMRTLPPHFRADYQALTVPGIDAKRSLITLARPT